MKDGWTNSLVEVPGSCEGIEVRLRRGIRGGVEVGWENEHCTVTMVKVNLDHQQIQIRTLLGHKAVRECLHIIFLDMRAAEFRVLSRREGSLALCPHQGEIWR